MSKKQRDNPVQAGKSAKKSYQKPRIVYREPLEAVAVACVPNPPGKSPGVCASTFS